MDEERSKAKARGTQNVLKEKLGVKGKESKSKVARTDLWLVGQGPRRNSSRITESDLENTKMTNSNVQENEKNRNNYSRLSKDSSPLSESKTDMQSAIIKNDQNAENEAVHQSQVGTPSERLRRNAIFQKNQNEKWMRTSGTQVVGIEVATDDDQMMENETEHRDKIETQSGSQRRNAIFAKNANGMLQQEAEHTKTEQADISLIEKQNHGSDEEITEPNARVRNSANTSDAISEIRLDGSKQGSNLVSASDVGAISAESVHSFQGMPAHVGSDQTINGMALKEVQSLDLLSSSSKSIVSETRNTASIVADGIELGKIPQKVAQKSNEMYRDFEVASLKMMDARKSTSKVEVSSEKSLGQRIREVKVVLEGDVDKTFFLKSSLNVREAKEEIMKKLRITKAVVLRANGRILRESESLETVGDVVVELKNAVEESKDCLGDVKSANRPKVVQVKILQEDGTWKYSKVAVMNVGSRKQYMGGYRDKRTGQVYYHVICQTEPRSRPTKERKTREVQANLPTVDFGINTCRVSTTQTSTYPQSTLGKIVKARPYIPYNEVHKTMIPHRAAQIIQRAWRRCIFRRFLSKHFQKLAASVQVRADEESSSTKVLQQLRLQTMTAAIFPSFRSHFSDLLMFINYWAKRGAERLASTKMGFARKYAMYELLRLEQEMLFAVETQRLKAVEENLRRQDIMFLEGTARSRARIYDKGNVTLVDDLNIQKAGVFKEIFASYSRTDATPTERLEILHCLRQTLLQEFGVNNLTVNDLLEILDREIDLITIGFPNAQMFYLRKRFETKFLHLARDPEVNPQAKYFRKSHLTEKKYAIQRCKLCNKNLPPSLMFKHVRMKKFRICMSCVQLEQNAATNQLNLAPFKRILSAMRARELEKNCRSAIPFLLQPLGTYFLVNVIWNGKSILSENTDLSQLRMTRWLPDQDWSVWNMILLTEKEAAQHDRVPNPMTHYPEDFVLKVRTRNILGRMNFMYLVDIDNDFKFGRVPAGNLPRDHLLYTNKHQARYIPDDAVPEFFKPAT